MNHNKAQNRGWCSTEVFYCLQHVRDIFGCDNLDGAHLEDEGGSGTAGSHWESRLFMGEIMVGNSLASSRDTLSNITMALAEDSGWYV